MNAEMACCRKKGCSVPRHTQDLVYPSSSGVSRVYSRLQSKILCLVLVPAYMDPGACWSTGCSFLVSAQAHIRGAGVHTGCLNARLMGCRWGAHAGEVPTGQGLPSLHNFLPSALPSDRTVSQLPQHAPSQQVLVLKGHWPGFFQVLKLMHCCLPRL